MDPLLERASSGDRAARDELMRRFEVELKTYTTQRLGLKLRRQWSVADVCQEVFLQVFRGLDTLPADASLDTFKGRLFQNAIWMIDRMARRGARFAGESAGNDLERAADASGGVTRTDELEWLKALAERLRDPYRSVLVRRLAGRGFAEIAAELGDSEAAVRKRYVRAFRMLREIVERKGSLDR